jgi:hypothetical protein
VTGARAIARADCLRDQRIDAHDHPHAHDRKGEEDGIGQTGAGQLARAETAEDRHVDEAHQVRAGLRRRQRSGQLDQRTKLGFKVCAAHRRRDSSRIARFY